MGNTKSEKASNCEQHERLGEVKLMEGTDLEGNLVEEMIVTKMVESEQQFNLWLKSMNKIDDSMTREVLLLPSKSTYESTGMCGSSGVVHLKYDHYPYVFQMQIENRKRINRYFLQTELWYLLYNMIRAGSKFQKYHSKIGDVHPNSILINNDGLVKLISTCSFPGETTNFDKFMENKHEKVYLAPEQLENIHASEYPKNIDPSSAQCFSIGLCMLAAGTLEDVDSAYLKTGEQWSIQNHKISYLLKLFGQRYSSYLHSIVAGLLAESPLNRKKCSEIYASLYEFEDKILDLETFLPGNSRLITSQQQQPVMMNSSYSNTPQLHQTLVNFVQPPPKTVNMYYSQNGRIVNPIESKYIPTNNVVMSQMRAQQGQGFMPRGSVGQGGFRGSAPLQIPRGL